MTDATYKGECRLKRWADSPQGMTVTVQLDDGPDGCKVNPFKDLQLGQRLAVMFVPINDDETMGGGSHTDSSDAALGDEPVLRGTLGDAAEYQNKADEPPPAPDRAQDTHGGVVSAATAAPKPGISAASKPKRKWHELPPSQQAAIACANPDFQAWCRKRAAGTKSGEGRFSPTTEEEPEATAQYVRAYCGVQSRKELDSFIIAADEWKTLWFIYEADTGRHAEERS